ncbi:MAG: class I SAM-dependent methyltransferase [Proteobacteria bacterium]|nr:class I SAM-dependent methyltransferase [Pseudomonadota bacterium]
MAKEFVKSGIQDVWAIDASPYLLGRAAKRFPEVKFIHGLAESLPFADGRFEAVGVCFLFHELPSVIARQVLQEIYRVLAPGGIVVITEPSPEQMRIKNWWHLIRLSGLKALYFHLLARLVFEPFVEEWHALEPSKWFAESGFQMLRDEKNLPFRFLVAKK